MPQGDKSKYTAKQKRQAEKIAEGYESRGDSEKAAKSRAWATVNAMSGGGKSGRFGPRQEDQQCPGKKRRALGGQASAARPAKQRVASAKKAAATRARHRSG